MLQLHAKKTLPRKPRTRLAVTHCSGEPGTKLAQRSEFKYKTLQNAIKKYKLLYYECWRYYSHYLQLFVTLFSWKVRFGFSLKVSKLPPSPSLQNRGVRSSRTPDDGTLGSASVLTGAGMTSLVLLFPDDGPGSVMVATTAATYGVHECVVIWLTHLHTYTHTHTHTHTSTVVMGSAENCRQRPNTVKK